PADAEIDPFRIERGERAELLGDDQRGMIGQHDPACAETYACRAAGEIADDHGGRGTGDACHIVVFGYPIAIESEPLGVLRQIETVAQRECWRRSDCDGHQVEY